MILTGAAIINAANKIINTLILICMSAKIPAIITRKQIAATALRTMFSY